MWKCTKIKNVDKPKIRHWDSNSLLYQAIDDLASIEEGSLKVFSMNNGQFAEHDVEHIRPPPDKIVEYVDRIVYRDAPPTQSTQHTQFSQSSELS